MSHRGDEPLRAVNAINGKERPLYFRAATYEVFLGGYSTLKNDQEIFTNARCPANVKKNNSIAVSQYFPLSNCLKTHFMRA